LDAFTNDYSLKPQKTPTFSLENTEEISEISEIPEIPGKFQKS
jgi:hypothetical protein